ncbi:STAS domain-containing protein [Methylomonas sp. SURF-2]|uniref:STAS domain-containing protein n=1 Tax=Methylomonas subterranea TaxID=2952225 RepID=A0ABT1TJ22_9GAMM|nr:STAS domain-containing protein [Methylomonas sp. SURF-2]MCQ8105228.1 STAS domain-containing protein [Methylomonas sp. SURF-2]
MAEQDESSMIGYDPLAWLHDSPEAENTKSTAVPESRPAPAGAGGVDEEGDASECEDIAARAVEAAQNVVEPDVPVEWDETEADLTDLALQSAPDQGQSAESSGHIALEPVQSIQTVGELHRRLLDMLDSCNKIDIDASAVSQIDTATLQLLLVLKLTAVKQQKEVSIDFPSEKFMEAADLLGLSEMLSVDRAVAGFF